MKKTYMTPALEVVKIEEKGKMLAGSIEVEGETNQNLGRFFDLDESDDEDF